MDNRLVCKGFSGLAEHQQKMPHPFSAYDPLKSFPKPIPQRSIGPVFKAFFPIQTQNPRLTAFW